MSPLQQLEQMNVGILAMVTVFVTEVIALFGLFAIALVKDGPSLPIIVDAAVKLIAAAVASQTIIGGIHIVVNGRER